MSSTRVLSRIDLALLLSLSAGMIVVGVLHFVKPAGFVAIVPRALPAPEALVYISGVFEVLGGLGLLYPPTRRFSAWGLIALFIAVFPANINMAIHNIQPPGMKVGPVAQWVRLPLQFVLIAWAYRFAARKTTLEDQRPAGK